MLNRRVICSIVPPPPQPTQARTLCPLLLPMAMMPGLAAAFGAQTRLLTPPGHLECESDPPLTQPPNKTLASYQHQARGDGQTLSTGQAAH